ncbi:uncharacterized protein PG986_009920 [Apiospora aurea]|uniref:DUF7580 domain-containing protein n=1 Tax=Apiospora aurea TaxID=335848 RepID=A0ABR1Q9F1_9PEZI
MAELGLAIAPLCIGAIKGTCVVLKRLKVLRHRNEEIKRLQKKFRTQTDNFLDECESFFQELLDDGDLAEELVKDEHHPLWDTVQLKTQVKDFLGRRAGRLEEIMQDIQGYISELDESLNAIPVDTKLKGVRQKKEAAEVLLKRSKYDSLVDAFKESIHELKNIRKASAKRKSLRDAVCSGKATSLRCLPPSYRDISRHSESFHDAISTFWSCLQKQHVSHDLRLLLDSRQDGSFRVVVRSENLRFVQISIPRALFPTNEDRPRPKKVRKVRFSDDCAAGSSSVPESDTTSSKTPCSAGSSMPTNLCSCGDLCKTVSGRCGGYLDTPDEVRHHLFPVCDDRCNHKECINEITQGTPVPLGDVFGYPVEQSISVPQQLRVALRLVKGTLQFASTPWLQALWCLRDVSYFQRTNNLAAALETMHISSDLSHKGRRDVNMAEMAVADELSMAQRVHGVGNPTLYSLGKALLQIGLWTLLPTEDISEIRRLAECNSRLGPVYERITQQCLDCNFASSKDLHDPDLQNAIYRDAVCGLEGIITSLEGR